MIAAVLRFAVTQRLLVLLGTGLLVYWMKPGPAGAGLLAAGMATGVFVVTAGDLYGPHWFGMDLSLNKTIPIRERFRVAFQAECVNALNHPTWGPATSGTSSAIVPSLSFGQTTGGPTGPRVIEFRVNIEF